MSQAQAAQHWPDPVNMKLSEPGLASRLSRKARKLRSKWFRLTASDLLLFITGESQSGLCKAVFCWILYNKRAECRELLYIHSPLLINNLIWLQEEKLYAGTKIINQSGPLYKGLKYLGEKYIFCEYSRREAE